MSGISSRSNRWSSGRNSRPARKNRSSVLRAAVSSVMYAEPLEQRQLLSAGQWYGVFSGMSGAGFSVGEQEQYGSFLLHNNGVQSNQVAVVGALDLSGTF